MKESLHDGHRKRLREKFKTGKDSFAEHELLELLLSYSIPRKDTNALAHKLINAFGSLKNVLSAPPEALTCIDGVGENTATHLSLVNYVNKVAQKSPSEKIKLSTIESVKRYVKNLYEGAKSEKLFLLFLDSNKNLLGATELDDDSINSVSINLETLTKSLVFYKPSSVILTHNHFADYPYPSKDDDKATAKIYAYLNLHKVNLYDHVIVGKKDSYSYFYDNRLQKIKENMNDLFI